MKPEAIKSSALPHPAFSYSQAVKAGNFIFVSGQAGVDYTNGTTSEDFETQARQAFANLAIVLHAAGSDMKQVVKTTIWLKDPVNFETLNKLYAEYFPENPPARSTPIVNLPKANLQISIEAVAVIE